MGCKARNIAPLPPTGKGAFGTCFRFYRVREVVVVVGILLFFLLSPIRAHAVEQGLTDHGDIYQEVADALPEQVIVMLPNGLYEEMQKGAQADFLAMAGGTDSRYLYTLATTVLKKLLSPFLEALIGCMSMTVVAVFLHNWKPLSGEAAEGISFLLSVAMILSVKSSVSSAIHLMLEALESVTVFMRALLPCIAVLYVAGGNYTAAVCEEGFLLLILEVMEAVTNGGLKPVLEMGFLIAACSHIIGEGRLNGLLSSVSKMVSLILTFAVTIFSAVLAHQHSIAQSADTMLLRTVKFAATGVIPIVGGAMSDAMGSAMGAVSFLRTTVGAIITLVILLLLITPIAYLLGTRIALWVTVMLAGLLGCREESTLYSEVSGLFDLGMAILAICFLTLLIAITFMIRCSTAAG